MKLNLEIIRAYFPENESLKLYGAETRKLIFRRPLLYEKGMEFAAGKLYVARTADLPKSGSVSCEGLICVGRRMPSSWLASDTQLLWIPSELSPVVVLNQVYQIYDRFDAWDEELRDELEKDADFDIKRLLLLGTRMLENPLSVAGNTLQNLFNVELRTDERGEKSYYVSEQNPDIPQNLIELVKQVCNLERALTVPYLSSIDLPDQQCYCNNLYPMGHFMGCISVSSRLRPFRESDFPLADHFFAYFQTAFRKYLQNNDDLRESPEEAALQKLLRQETMDDNEKALLRLNPEESYILFKLKGRKGDTKCFPKDYMLRALATLMPQNLCAVMYHREIVGLIRLGESGADLLDAFGTFIERMGYYAGLSNRFRQTENIRDCLLQAHYVTENYANIPCPQTLLYFRDQTLTYLLHACTLEMSAASLIPRNLARLKDHDQRKGTEYVKTLDAYLRNEMNATRTAEELFIHRTSLMKRLNKLTRLLEDDLSDPDRRLVYRICLHL